jgi:hypothetical protein
MNTTGIYQTDGTVIDIGSLTDGQFLKRVGGTLVSAAAGTGTVTNVSSANTSIAVANPGTTPALTVATLDVLATNGPPAANIAMNSKKLTGLAAGSGAGDSVRYEQALLSGAVTATDASIVVAGTGVAPTIATGTLDAIATAHPPAANVAMNSKKLTSLAAGSGAGDSVRYEQVLGSNVLAVSNLGAGSAGQVLQGTGPTYAYPPGYEINYTQITSPVNVTDTSESTATALISPGAITFDGSAVLVEVFAVVQCDTNAVTDVLIFSLFEGSTQITRFGTWRSIVTATASIHTMRAAYRFTPTAASHTYKVTGFVNNTTGTPQILAGAAGTNGNPPAFVRFTKV